MRRSCVLTALALVSLIASAPTARASECVTIDTPNPSTTYTYSRQDFSGATTQYTVTQTKPRLTLPKFPMSGKTAGRSAVRTPNHEAKVAPY